MVGVEAAQDEQVHREPDQPEREAAERPRCGERVGGAVLAVLEERADDRAAEHEDADAGRDGHRAIIRTPSDIWRMNDVRSRRATALDISGWNVVAIETASSPWGSTKNVNASK